MTAYDHAMVGANLAWIAGLQRKYGWPIVAISALTSALPDWDGLSILFGAEAYARAHRVWGHNLIVASALAAAVAALGYILYARGRFDKLAARFQRSGVVAVISREFRTTDLAVWVLLGIVSSLSHLAFDLVYSGHAQLTPWPLPLLWPFSERAWVYPIVPYGDLGATGLFIAEMFALYKWPLRATAIAWISLSLVLIYVAARWQLVSGTA